MVGRPRKQAEPTYEVSLTPPRWAPVKVRVLWPNVWTSLGKFYQGDEVELTDPAEIALLDARDQIKIVR